MDTGLQFNACSRHLDHGGYAVLLTVTCEFEEGYIGFFYK